MDELNEILADELNAGPADDKAITDAESKLSISFPAQYRSFLKCFGATSGQGYEIAGLFLHEDDEEPPMWTNVVEFTKQLREAPSGELHPSLLPISDDGVGTFYYLICGVYKSFELGSVVGIGPSEGEVLVSDSFVEFVNKLKREELF